MLPEWHDRAVHPRRHAWLDRLEQLDPVVDCVEVYRITIAHEFPWDALQALSLALFRTYAVPGIGGLLAQTGEFTERTYARYADTSVLLEAVLEHGFGSRPARDALGRVNAMHAAYDLDPGDMTYVLSTLCVGPKRWLDAYGWRPMSEREVVASVHYYRALGARMGVRGVPETYEGLEQLHDAYEREHFGYDEGGRAVAEATLALLARLPPNAHLPARLVRLGALALMDDPLLDALRLPHPPRAVRAAVRAGLRVRGRALRWAPPRRTPRWVREGPAVHAAADGSDLLARGTFPQRGPLRAL